MTTAKTHINHLIAYLKQAGIRDIVISPGSRNAPLVIALTSDDSFRCYSIVDERSAGFYALGISIATKSPTVVVCTSGSALLNYAPAVAEAYYQHVPLLVLSADRPTHLIDQGDGQTINQKGVYKNYCKASFHLEEEPVDKQALQLNKKYVSEAISLMMNAPRGPVHINVPLKEPLYDLIEKGTVDDSISFSPPSENKLSSEQVNQLLSIWNGADKKMIIVGQQEVENKLTPLLEELSTRHDTVVLTETTSNIHSDKLITTIDRTITGIPENQRENFKPDLLLYTGGAIVSKKIKAFFRQHNPEHCWFVDESGDRMDTFKSLTEIVQTNPFSFFQILHDSTAPKAKGYVHQWNEVRDRNRKIHQEYLREIPFSDLKVFDYLMHHIPDGAFLHIANSSPIRYTQLFDYDKDYRFLSNRGVSGIDGSLSTAAGFALQNDDLNIFITGDLSLMYDSNGYWSLHFPKNLKTIVINNGGGGIFDIIPGPDNTKALDQYIATRQDVSFSKLAALFDLDYFYSDDESSIVSALNMLLNSPGSALLEIKTHGKESGHVLRNYFKRLESVSNRS